MPLTSHNTSADNFSVTGAAAVYAASLIIGGLAILGLLVYPHTAFTIVACSVALVVGLAGASYSIRSVVKSLNPTR